MPNTNTETLTDALRHYAWLSEANTTGRVGRTAEAWDAGAARIEGAIGRAVGTGLTPGQLQGAADRARDARLNAASLRARR